MRLQSILGVLLIVSVVAPHSAAQTDAPQAAPGAPTFKPEELEQIAAPIALYPDPLLAQIFMAATYPVEIVQAARFAQANPSLKGDQLNEELKKFDWDDSVKSLVSFPDVLTMMDQKLDWTQKLGDAVLGQQKELMDAIQRLRAKAQASGNLKTNEQQNVSVEPAPAAAPAPGTPPPSSAPPPQIITIQPANPQVVYVPTYEPAAVYGGWPYPAYPPYSYYPPGYVAGTAMLSFGVGMAVGAAVWGGCNWGHGEIDVDVDRQSDFNRNVNRTSNTNTQRSGQRANAQGGKQNWQHDPGHRKGAQYRDTATQQRYNKQGVPNSASREAYRGRAEQGRQEMARNSGTGAGTASGANRAATRDSGQAAGGARGGAESASVGSGGGRAGGGEARAAAGGGGAAEARGAGAGGGAQARSAGAGGGAGAQPRSAGAGGQRAGGAAFEGAGQGRAAQSYSQRGGSSMSSARASGYQGGGGGGARAGGGGARGGGGGRR
jgi:Protein of unknown function (DUF3300)